MFTDEAGSLLPRRPTTATTNVVFSFMSTTLVINIAKTFAAEAVITGRTLIAVDSLR